MVAKKQVSSISDNFEIVNVVSSTRAKRDIDIEKLATHLDKIQYEPGIFPGLIYRRTCPKVTLTIFSTGKIVSTGAKSEEDSRRSIFATLSEIADIEKKGIEIEQIKTENIVSVSLTGFEIDLNRLHKCGLIVAYEPSVFSGAICDAGKNMKFLVFKNGKMVLVGSKNTREAKEIVEVMLEKLRKSKEIIAVHDIE
jgi:transcription initiation factor TFIID TATA-box-binding protein